MEARFVRIFTIGGLCVYLSAAQSNRTYGTVEPVLAQNFPDPALVETDGAWFAFATSGNGNNVQVAASSSFENHNWKLLEIADPLPDPGLWAVNDGNVWAPDVNQLEDGRWIMYYAAPSQEDRTKHCIGSAVSTNIIGPYEPAVEPLACPLEKGGAIDPSAFFDPNSGRLYVVYKIDGNSLNSGDWKCAGGGNLQDYHSTPIMLQEVSPADGQTRVGEAIQILDRDESDGPLIEAPSLLYNQESDLYFLTFSSNCYASDYYDISFAFSSVLTDNFTKSKHPLMTSQTGPVLAPGGADMTADGKYALYHGTVSQEGEELVRYLFAAEAQQIGQDMSAFPI